MASFQINQNNLTTNTAKSTTNVYIVVHNGIINGNIIPETNTDCPTALIFSCQDNSQYIPLI
jgi:hypothetical protein